MVMVLETVGLPSTDVSILLIFVEIMLIEKYLILDN
jgi:hypothetical protein